MHMEVDISLRSRGSVRAVEPLFIIIIIIIIIIIVVIITLLPVLYFWH